MLEMRVPASGECWQRLRPKLAHEFGALLQQPEESEGGPGWSAASLLPCMDGLDGGIDHFGKDSLTDMRFIGAQGGDFARGHGFGRVWDFDFTNGHGDLISPGQCQGIFQTAFYRVIELILIFLFHIHLQGCYELIVENGAIHRGLDVPQRLAFESVQVLLNAFGEGRDQVAAPGGGVIGENDADSAAFATAGKGTSNFSQTTGANNHLAFALHDLAFKQPDVFVREAQMTNDTGKCFKCKKRPSHARGFYTIFWYNQAGFSGGCPSTRIERWQGIHIVYRRGRGRGGR